jgi:hypothetical protein
MTKHNQSRSIPSLEPGPGAEYVDLELPEHETGQREAIPSLTPMRPAQGEDADECQNGRSE